MDTNSNTQYLRVALALLLFVLVAFGVYQYRGEVQAPAQPISEETGIPSEPEQNDVSVSYSDGVTVVPATFHILDDTVTFTHPELGTVTLTRALSGSGARYANADESIVFWEHQDELTVTKDGVQVFQGPNTERAPNGALTEAQAKAIAEKTCIKGGESLSSGMHNDNTRTWWFDANLNAVRNGCNPACVVSEETNSAEINWRCTGLIVPDTPPEGGRCVCPSGYRQEGESCTPECYYSKPPCLAPSVSCVKS